jgi:hypothetical protein
MDNSEKERSIEANLFNKYSDYSDEQILEILIKRKDYQEVAVETAIKIALDRKIIDSRQDLLAPEFRINESGKKSLFPEISNTFHRSRVIGSIFRFMYLMSLLPLTYGILNYAKGEIVQTMLGVGIGLLWFVLCLLLKKTQNVLFFIPLFILMFGVSIITGFGIFKKETFQLVDVFVLLISTLLPFYLMLYLKTLIKNS